LGVMGWEGVGGRGRCVMYLRRVSISEYGNGWLVEGLQRLRRSWMSGDLNVRALKSFSSVSRREDTVSFEEEDGDGAASLEVEVIPVMRNSSLRRRGSRREIVSRVIFVLELSSSILAQLMV
jgi:hypothetical protein